MALNKIIIWGATGQAIVLEEILRKDFEIVAMFDNNVTGSPIKNVSLFGGTSAFKTWNTVNNDNSEIIYFAVAIGGGNGFARLEVHQYLKSNGLTSIAVIHPTAFVAYNVEVGEGAQILANSSVCARVKLGTSVIINTAASVDHECVLGDGVHIGPGAKLAGCVEVGSNTFIGTGAVILPRIKIGKNCTIGAGSVVTKNIDDNVIAFGNPCKPNKKNF